MVSPKLFNSSYMANSDIQILQFGTGNFLRAFFEPMVQELNKNGNNLNICIIQTTTGNTLEKLKSQNFQYHVLEAGFRSGQRIQQTQQITCVKDGLKLPEESKKFLDFAASPPIKWIISNVTEAGMVWKNEEPMEKFAESFPGRLTQWLYHRFVKNPKLETVILPCELLPSNGDLLRDFVLRHAKNWELPAPFSSWIDEKVLFLNSLVDRIVPGFPSHLDFKLKEVDPLLVQTEPYSFWAIEGSESIRHKLPFLGSDSEVKLAGNISGFALRKVRILNGAHTAMTGDGLLKGIFSVGEWIEHPNREAFLLAMIQEEIIPTIGLDQAELNDYSQEVIDRFKNPFVTHKLSDISLNSIAKIKSRLIPTMEDFKNITGNYPHKLSFCLISLVLFYLRNPEKIRDSPDIKEWFEAIGNSKSESENLKEALSTWLNLKWNPVFESAYSKLG